MGTPSNVKVGAGLIYTGAVGSTEPTDLTTAWSSAWTPQGYTEDGSKHNIAPSFDPLEVAEELIPIRYEETKREITVSYTAAEMTVDNVFKAFNGGVLTALPLVSAGITGTPSLGTGGVVTVTAHDLVAGERVMFAAVGTATGVAVSTSYFVRSTTSTTVTLSATVGGAALTTGAGTLGAAGTFTRAVARYEPPDIGTATRIAVGWEAQDHQERWVFRRCLQTGAVEITHNKAPNKATIPMSFQLETVVGGVKPFMNIFA